MKDPLKRKAFCAQILVLGFLCGWPSGCQHARSIFHSPSKAHNSGDAASQNTSAKATAKPIPLIWPVSGAPSVTSPFGWRWPRYHKGVDIGAAKGSPIFAVQKGKVAFAGWKSGYGRTVILDHDSFRSLYAHCDELKVKRAQMVNQGQVIALAGYTGRATGAHLHFEWRTKEDISMNPESFLPLVLTKRTL